MLKVTEFDIKTGQTLTAYDPELRERRPKAREIQHSYLEHWLDYHGLEDSCLWMARFYPGVQTADQSQLETEGKVLVFTHGDKGYFTNEATAQLLTRGDPAQGIAPLYEAGLDSAHYLAAYGSLLISDGGHSALIAEPTGPTRILVVDDESLHDASASLLNPFGQDVTSKQIEQVLDRMGDGTMFVSRRAIRALAQPDESQEYLSRSVIQFRAATPDLPGMLKGTLSYSSLVDRLGVDALVSKSCIKGDDGRLSKSGLHEVRQLWLNRKLEARYNFQSVGAQLKGTIPDATAQELNPRVLEKTQKFAQLSGDVYQLAEYYQQQQLTLGTAEEDWLSKVVEQDRYGVMLNGFPTVVDKLERFVRHEWMDLAMRGIRIPSAMAQPHHQLKPWEVCNRKLPDGAIVVYYRSPVPNVSAVAIAINNPNAIRQTDREAYKKQGVAYLNPWTAQNIAITDFDGDVNGYFVGYQPVAAGLTDWVRQQLKDTENLAASEQYEAGRQLFAELIKQLENEPSKAQILPGECPKAVAEFVERTSPEQKPPAIAKQLKIKHPWHEHETLAQATWRAWSITAENPIGRVANAGMVLQSFASECLYARTDEAKEALLQQLSKHYRKLLQQVEQGKLTVPENEALTAKGLPAYNLKARLQTLSEAGPTLQKLHGAEQQRQHVAHHLQAAHKLLSDVANGPNAANLQTAVDAAKSARDLDEEMYQLAISLQYKPHLLRQHRKDPNAYTAERTLPTNTDEPIGWMVESVNALYREQTLNRSNNVGMKFGSLMDGVEFTPEQKADAERMVTRYLKLMSERSATQRQLSDTPSASRQPYLTITSAQTGRSLTIERLIDATTGNEAKTQDLWRVSGATDWQITIEPIRQNHQIQFAVKRQKEGDPSHLLGWVSEASAKQHQLSRFFQNRRQLQIANPLVEVHPPLALENDVERMMDQAIRFLQENRDRIPESERSAYAAALWSLQLPTGEKIQGPHGMLEKRAKLGMGLALQLFPVVVGKRLQTLPPLQLSGHRYREVTPEPGEHQVVTKPYQYLDKTGHVQEVVGVSLVDSDGGLRHLGYLGERTLQLPLGLPLQADIQIETIHHPHSQTEKLTIQVTELLEQAQPSEKTQLDSKAGQYAPTYDELQTWWRAVRRQQDTGKLTNIEQLGQALVELYRNESASPTAVTPRNYRSIEVCISSVERAEMLGAISSSISSTTHQQHPEQRGSTQMAER